MGTALAALETRFLLAAGIGDEYPARSRNKQWLIKRIAWQMQANIYGGLSERTLARAAELVKVAQLRMLPPRESKAMPARERTKVVACTLKA